MRCERCNRGYRLKRSTQPLVYPAIQVDQSRPPGLSKCELELAWMTARASTAKRVALCPACTEAGWQPNIVAGPPFSGPTESYLEGFILPSYRTELGLP